MANSVTSAAFMERLVDYLNHRGVDVAALSDPLGFDPTLLTDPSTLVPLQRVVALYHAASAHLDQPTLGVDVAMHASLRDYGVAGFLIANHPTVDGSLREICHITNVMIPDLAYEIEEQEDTVRFSLTLRQPWPGAHIVVEELLAGMYRRTSEITEGSWSPVSVSLTTPATHVERYTQAFHCDVAFDEPVAQITLRREDLARTIPGANPTLLVHLREASQAQMARRRALVGNAEQLIRLDGCHIDLKRGEVVRSAEITNLTAKEQAILRYLAAHANVTVSHDALEAQVWGMGSQVISHAPAGAIRRLRQKIERDPSAPVNLVTVFGEGWKLSVPDQTE